MHTRTQAVASRCPPQGRVDLLRQILLFCGAYWIHQLVRGLVDAHAAAAFENPRQLISLERSLNLFIEPAVKAWASGGRWLTNSASAFLGALTAGISAYSVPAFARARPVAWAWNPA